MASCLISLPGCGEKRIHVATTSGAPGSTHEQSLTEEGSAGPDAHGLSDADLHASALEGDLSSSIEGTEQDPMPFAHEVAPRSDTMLEDTEAGLGPVTMEKTERLDPTGELGSGQDIHTQSRLQASAESSLPAIGRADAENQAEAARETVNTASPEPADAEREDTLLSSQPLASIQSEAQDPDLRSAERGNFHAPRDSTSGLQLADRQSATIPSLPSDHNDEDLAHMGEPEPPLSSGDDHRGAFGAYPPQPLALGEGDEPEAMIPPENVPEEIAVAKAEPSETIQHQIEKFQEEEHAALRDIFFEFDRWTLTPEGRAALEANADWLSAQPSASLVIQGHCDERGTQAYNLVLGEKRAMAIREYLIELGIDPARLTIVSYGKEKPFCTDSTEVCYQLNRRGHLVVRQP